MLKNLGTTSTFIIKLMIQKYLILHDPFRLEEKQRSNRRQREGEAEKAAAEGRPYPPYEPVWFSKEKDEGTDNVIFAYKGQYWESKAETNWSKCPDIFQKT